MKSSEIAGIIRDQNPKLHIGGLQPFLPLMPMQAGPRNANLVGWVAFNLIRCLEVEQDFAPAHPVQPRRLWFQSLTCTFALMKAEHVPLPGTHWEQVEFDGYGGLETWKELAR